MINKHYSFVILFILIFSLLLVPNFNNAKEILIYADSISYDKDKNIIAKGNAKIFQSNKLILSELIIFNQIDEKIILPSKFVFKDNSNNYFEGENGYFIKDLEYAEFDNPKIRLQDGSRLIGKKIKRNGKIDIISKGVYTPCTSRIKIGNFICPTWQLEGEKILHDNENLFLYQKHSKMRVLNTPVFYIPYIVAPSPLRKDRKSGFLLPSIALNFFDTKTSQSTSFPYYFNIDLDKELLFTPIINYGGGVDASQRFIFDYNQIISGGNLKTELTFDSNFENTNNNKWLSDASLITNFNKNLNEKYKIQIDSALQTSKNYIQITKPNDDLSYTNSLSSNFILEGFNLKKIDDQLKISFNFYQTNQENEDNKTLPIVFPKIKYFSGYNNKSNYISNSEYEFYNIFREKSSLVHAKQQQKISQRYNIKREIINFNSKISLEADIYNQIFKTEKKLISSNNYKTGTYYRLFPIMSISTESPFKFKKHFPAVNFNPKINLVVTPGISNSSKLSNEDSTNNDFSLENIYRLNRYSGNDKMDNSKRITYGLYANTSNFDANLSQSYEFTNNSNFHNEAGNEDNLSDVLGSIEYNNKNQITYNFRYNVSDEYLKKQNINFTLDTQFGEINTSYLDQNSKINNIITKDTETVNYSFLSKKFNKFSKINFKGLYDLKEEINKEYTIGYSYFDECFGINIDFNRKSYEEDNLKPQDILTLMFSFKNIGSYKSSNLAVSENDKQDIQWENIKVDKKEFQKNE
ncbi:LPS assembly protein LptD [Pelagibacteraceae bacterium]|nr:LPS assembly protein LptD [Pelagibacteraceae bacterium]